MAIANLALRFLLEVAGFAGAGYVAYALTDGLATSLRLALAVAASLALIGLWAFTVAPRRQNGLTQAQKDVIGSLILVIVALGIGLLGQPQPAIGFAVVVAGNAALLFVFGQDARNRFDAR